MNHHLWIFIYKPFVELTPDILRTFTAAAQTLNFTQAGKQVNLTQSAVSVQIRKLEEHLGKVLFKRVARGVELTGDGELLLTYANQILHLYTEAFAKLSESSMQGVIRFGAPEDYAAMHLSKILRRFSEKYPFVQVELYCDLSNNLLKMLEAGHLDLCLVNAPSVKSETKFLRREPVIWIGPKDSYPERQLPLPLSLYHHGCIYRHWATRALEKKDLSYRIAYSSPSISGVLAGVESGLAVAPVGASTPVSNFRILPEGTLPALPAAMVCLHQSKNREDVVLTHIAQYITDEFRMIPTLALHPGNTG